MEVEALEDDSCGRGKTLASPDGRGFHSHPLPAEGPGMRACAGSLMKAKSVTRHYLYFLPMARLEPINLRI